MVSEINVRVDENRVLHAYPHGADGKALEGGMAGGSRGPRGRRGPLDPFWGRV